MDKVTLLLVSNKDLGAVTKGRSQPPQDFLKENLEAGCVGGDLTLQHSAPPMSQNSKRAEIKNIKFIKCIAWQAEGLHFSQKQEDIIYRNTRSHEKWRSPIQVVSSSKQLNLCMHALGVHLQYPVIDYITVNCI